MKKLRVIFTGLAITSALGLVDCSSIGHDWSKDAASYSADRAPVWNRSGEMAVDLQDRVVSATAEYDRFLIFTTKNESYNGATNTISSVSLDGLGTYAAYKATTDANADGIYVIRSKRESSGFPLLNLWRTEKVTVWGMPFKYKFLGIMDEKRADEKRKQGGGSIFGF